MSQISRVSQDCLLFEECLETVFKVTAYESLLGLGAIYLSQEIKTLNVSQSFKRLMENESMTIRCGWKRCGFLTVQTRFKCRFLCCSF